MYLFSRLFQAARAWRNGGRPKTAKRSAVGVEQLDHRQLLSVNFSGNVATDFTPTTTPTPQFPTGVVLFNSANTPGIITPNTAFYGNLIGTSGYAISGIAVSYDSTDDTLSVGFEQPPSGKPGQPGPVIAGDADNNGNAGNVNPLVTDLDFGFTEYPALEGSGTEMNAFLDLADTGTPDIVAGFSPIQPPLPPNQSPTGPNPMAPKPYQVAQAVPATEPFTGPSFGTLLPNNTGNVYLANLAAHPNLEFSITNFSQLYLAETGHALTPSSVIGIGAFAGNNSTAHINDAFFPENTFTLAQATVPVPPVNNNPEPSPPILINPHEHRIIDTGHRDLIRVSIFGTSGFPVKNINPATVELDGVASIAHVTRKVQRDEFPFQTYVFVADQLTLPPGLTTATLTGQTFSGVNFESQKDVLNLPHSALAFGRLRKYIGNANFYERLSKLEATNPGIANTSSGTTVSLASRNAKASGAAKIVVDYTPRVSAAGAAAKAESVKVRPVVSLKRAEAAQEESTVPTRVRYSMEHHLSAAG
jgi:hypothetical protein